MVILKDSKVTFKQRRHFNAIVFDGATCHEMVTLAVTSFWTISDSILNDLALFFTLLASKIILTKFANMAQQVNVTPVRWCFVPVITLSNIPSRELQIRTS